MFGFFVVFTLFSSIVNASVNQNVEEAEQRKAEIVLEKALGEIRSRVANIAGEDEQLMRRPPTPPATPPRASDSHEMRNHTWPGDQSSETTPMLPGTVLINPVRIDMLRPKTPTVANFVVRPNEPTKGVHKFEFMPHFDRDKYEFMVPEGPPVQLDTLVAVLTFFGQPNGELPQFLISSDRSGWFSIGEVVSNQEPNYIVSEVPILRHASANISWTDTEEGIYTFRVQGSQGKRKASEAQVRVEVLPVRNYTHLEMEPAEQEQMEPSVNMGKEIMGREEEEDGPKEADEQIGLIRNVELAESNQTNAGSSADIEQGKEEWGEEQRQEEDQIRRELELLQMDPLGIDVVEVTTAAGDLISYNSSNHAGQGGGEADLHRQEEEEEEVLHKDEEERAQIEQLFGPTPTEGDVVVATNSTVVVQLDGQSASSGRVQVEFAELASLLHSPIPKLVAKLPEIDALGMVPNVVRLELRPTGVASSQLDIRPHFLAPGDRAQLWLSDPEKLEKIIQHQQEGSHNSSWEQHFSLFVHQPVNPDGHHKSVNTSARLLFSGQLRVIGGPKPGARFARTNGYEFAVSEGAKDGQVLGKLEVERPEGSADQPVSFTLFGHGANLFRVGPDGTVVLHCGETRTNCLDRESVANFNLAATVSLGNIVSDPVPVAILVEDVNDRPPRLELVSGRAAALSIVDGHLQGGPLVVAIRDLDSTAQDNRLLLEGNCSEMFRVTKLENSSDSPALFSVELAADGTEQATGECQVLDLVATDAQGQQHRLHVQIGTRHTQRRFRFSSPVYERSVQLERMHTGLPLVQMELAEASHQREMVVNYVIVDGNPGWLGIEPFSGNVFVADTPKDGIFAGKYALRVAAIDREKHLKLAEATLRLQVTDQHQQEAAAHAARHLHIPSPMIRRTIDRWEEQIGDEQEEEKGQTVGIEQIHWLQLFEDLELARHIQMVGDIEAWDDAGRPAEVSKDDLAYQPLNGSLRLDLARLGQIRSLHVHLEAGADERTLLALTFRSDPKKAEQRLRRMSRPVFAAPWHSEETPIRVRIAEEMPIGQPLLRLPAFSPLDGSPVPTVQLEGPNADSFSFDQLTGELRVAARLDFERSMRFQQISLVANSPAADRPVRAHIHIELLDVDDVPPEIRILSSDGQLKASSSSSSTSAADPMARLQVEENAQPGTELALVEVNDADSRKHRCELLGPHAAKFILEPAKEQKRRRQWTLVVGPGAELDREQMAQLGLVLRCVDFPGQNRAEVPLLISLLDQNDNMPLIGWAHQSEKVVVVPARDWPQGATISRFWARDRDARENGRVHFQLGDQQPANAFFRIDPRDGMLTAAPDRSLAELAELLGGEPVDLEIVARDNGHPPLSSSVRVKILLENGDMERPRQLRLLWPSIEDGQLQLGENVPAGRKVAKAEAVWAKGSRGTPPEAEDEGKIRYRISTNTTMTMTSEMEMMPLRIDEHSGDIFTTDAQLLDFERRQFWTFLITAYSTNGQEASALLELEVQNMDEHKAMFGHNLAPSTAKLSFRWPDSVQPAGTELLLGQVEAFDEDAPPFNRIHYSIVPKCSHPAALFRRPSEEEDNNKSGDEPPAIRVDSQSGQIRARTGFPHWARVSAVQLCILASAPSDNATIVIDSMPSQSLLRLQLLPQPPGTDGQSNSKRLSASLLRANNSHFLLEHRLAIQRVSLPVQMAQRPVGGQEGRNVSLHSVLFTPYGQSASGAQPIKSLGPMQSSLVRVDPIGAQLRFEPAVLGALGDGFYQFGLAIQQDQQLEQQQPLLLYRNVHFVDDRFRLRFLFNQSIHSLGVALGDFARELEQLLAAKQAQQQQSSDQQANNSSIRLVLSAPIREGQKQRSSVCFHLWSPTESILDLNSTIRLVSTNVPGQRPQLAEQLAAFYEQNSLLNIEPCLGANNNGAGGTPRFGSVQPTWTNNGGRSREWLFWSCVSAISLIVFVAMAGYFCFVRSYRQHLRRKSGDLLPAADEQSDSSPFHQQLNNKCSSVSVFSVPEFIRAKNILDGDKWRMADG